MNSNEKQPARYCSYPECQAECFLASSLGRWCRGSGGALLLEWSQPNRNCHTTTTYITAIGPFFFTARFSPGYTKPFFFSNRSKIFAFFFSPGLTRVSPIFNRSITVDDLRGVGVVLAQPITCDVYVVVFSEYGVFLQEWNVNVMNNIYAFTSLSARFSMHSWWPTKMISNLLWKLIADHLYDRNERRVHDLTG